MQRRTRADRSACRRAHVLQIRRSVRLPESDQQRRQQPHRQDRHRPVRRERQHLVEPEHVLRSRKLLAARGGFVRPDVYDHAAAAYHGGQRLRQRRLSHEAVCGQEHRQWRRGSGRVQFADRGAPGRERADERHRAPDPGAGRRRSRRRHR